MLTAQQARELAGKTPQEKVEDLLKAVEVAAKNKKRSLRTSYDYKIDDEFWVLEGYNSTKDYKEAVNILNDLGYKVSFYYQEGNVAVDMYTLIQW